MNDARAIKATFSTWRPVNGRKVLQLVFEVPIEQQGEVLTMLGAPDDKWCAIALLNLKPTGDSLGEGPPLSTVPRPQANEAGISKPKQRFADLPLSQQAGIRCADPAFTKFLQETGLHDCTRDTDDVVRHLCGVKSRTELTANDKAARLWHKLNVEYEEWLTDKQYAESIRR